jgi:hypothetical protein
MVLLPSLIIISMDPAHDSIWPEESPNDRFTLTINEEYDGTTTMLLESGIVPI